MIYTVTLNPAIDVSLHVKDGLMPGSVNKSYGMRTDPGGKGINVSKVLKVLDKKSVICMGICGDDGENLRNMLESEGFEVISVRYPSGNTRTNIKISGENGVTTDINGDGPLYDSASIETLKSLIIGRLKPGDIVVTSGSAPLGSPSDIYADLIKTFNAVQGVSVILDCSGRYLREGLKAGPYAIKPNCEELGIDSDCAIDEAGKIVLECGTTCLISMGSRGAVFADGQKNVYYSRAIDVKVSSLLCISPASSAD